MLQIEKLEDGTDDKPGLYRVTAKTNDGKEIVEEYNTVNVSSNSSCGCEQIISD